MIHGKFVGFDRKIDLEWLDAAAGQLAAGATLEDVRGYLWRLLEGTVVGSSPHGARQKSVGVITHVWVQVPQEVVALRNRALAILSDALPEERLALHWSLCIATYPFFAELATTAGRLLGLQGNFSLTQLMRRLAERWGDRTTLPRAAQRIVRSLVQWGVLQDTEVHGVYERAGAPRCLSGRTPELLVESLLLAGRDHMPVEQATGHPALFPFQLVIEVHQLRQPPQFSVYREGLDVDVVGLAQSVARR